MINVALAEAHKMYPDDVPSIDVPYPEERQTDAGAMYYYPLPASP